jgi:hypothetical protein
MEHPKTSPRGGVALGGKEIWEFSDFLSLNLFWTFSIYTRTFFEQGDGGSNSWTPPPLGPQLAREAPAPWETKEVATTEVETN